MALIAQHSMGIPRNINTICFNALSLAIAEKSKRVESEFVEEILADLNLVDFVSEPRQRPHSSAGVAQTKSPVIPTEKPPVRKRSVHAAYATLVAILLLSLGASLLTHSRPKLMDLKEEPGRRVALPTQSTTADERPMVQKVSIASVLPAPAVPSTDASRSASVPIDESTVMGLLEMPRIHVVQRNETIVDIARSEYRRASPKVIQQIVAMNPEIINPNHILTGQRLRIPRSTSGSPTTDP